MAADTVEHDGTLALDGAVLERTLSELWQRAAQVGDGPPVARARVITLVVHTEDEETAALAALVAQALPERHPSRVVLVRVHPDQDRPPSAALSIRCATSRAGERTVCSEVIEVTAGGPQRVALADAVAPLLVSDLPSVLWWAGRPRPADPLLRRWASGLVDRVMVDSALFRDPGAGLIALARWGEDPRRQAAVADLAWERLRRWRQLLAQTMDPPEARARLRALAEVEIGYGARALPEEALLLAGWLAAALGWQPLDSPAFGVVTFTAGARTVTLRFTPGEDGDEGQVRFVRLRAADGARYSVREGLLSGLAACVVEADGQAPLERLVPFGRPDSVDLVVRAIGRVGHDPVYDAALAAAADLAVLGVTA